MQVPPASSLSPSAGRAVGPWRVLTGLLQGVLLYLLSHAADLGAWPAATPMLSESLFLTALLLPVAVVSSLGNLDRRTFLLWTIAVAVVLVGLGCWDGWRVADLPLHPAEDGRHRYASASQLYRSPYPGPALVFLAGTALFIAHALVLAAARDRRRIAAYATYFDTGWTLGVQLAFSALFLGVTWLVLLMGAQLFNLVNLRFLSRLLGEQWFQMPVSAFAFACGLHLTDVRPAIVRGIRNLLLTLMSWLLPVTVLLVGGFLLALPFAGLHVLWSTRHAAEVLLCATGTLVVFVNAAWQDGAADAPRVLRIAARIAAVLPAPLVLIAVYALVMRVGDHGWTGDRMHAAACMLVAGCYAGGYLAAGLRPGWLPLVARVNTGTAFAVPLVIVALCSPLLDPARIAVASQVGRLESGRVKPDAFDFKFLRFEAARFGRTALERLAKSEGPNAAQVREHVAAAQRMHGRWEGPEQAEPPADLRVNLRVHPDGATLPDAFLHTGWATQKEARWELPDCLREGGAVCDAFMLDVDADGREEVVLMPEEARQSGAVFAVDAGGAWQRVARVESTPECPRLSAVITADTIRVVPPKLQDLEIGGVRLRLNPETRPTNCKGK